MDRQAIDDRLREAAPGLRSRYSVRSLDVFGSTVRGDDHQGSDVDVLVTFDPDPKRGIGFFILETIQDELATLLGRTVDLNTPGCLSPYFRSDVLRESEVVYEA